MHPWLCSFRRHEEFVPKLQDGKRENAHVGREEPADRKFSGIEDREAVDEK